MKTLQQSREASGGKEKYQKFVNAMLKKFGVKSPAELEGDKKKKFYDALDAGWDGDNEEPEKGDVKEAVSVDMRTKGFKEAMKRAAARKENYKKKKKKKDDLLDDANKALTGKNEDMSAVGSDATGPIDMPDKPLKKLKRSKDK